MSVSRRSPLWREYLEALLVAALFLGFANTFVLKTFYIPSGSMENTLLVGDHLVVNRFIYGSGGAFSRLLLPTREPRRGDVMVFRSPEDPRLDLVKRCIGLPGDQVRMVDKQLYVNDRRVDDGKYAIHRDPQIGTRRPPIDPHRNRRDNFSVTVPPGHYFFLGDNRDFSSDSRYWGPVPAHYLSGRVFIVYWSYGGGTPDGWPGWRARIAQLGRTVLGFLTKTRWDRSFQVIR